MKKQYDKGTAIYILSLLFDVDSLPIDPTSIVISVHDSTGLAKVTEQAMTKVLNGKYSYIWQSALADASGDYTVTVKAVHNTYTSINKMILITLK